MTERLRGRKAVRQRERRLRAEPLCRHCKAQGVTRAAEVIDHIIPLAHGGTDDDANTQPLCRSCHEEKTRADMGYREKPVIGIDGWPVRS